jgi:hypothetical protein
MTRHWMRAALVAVLAVAAVAQARSLWVRVKDAPLLKDGKVGAKETGKLPVGTQVDWLKADATKQFHEVKAGEKSGWMHVSSITPREPGKELDSSGAKVDPQKFASSGAATKALSPAAVKYSERKDLKKVAAELLEAEGIAGSVTAQDVVEFAKKSGLSKEGK